MYTINLTIDPTGVGQINGANQFITLVKSVVTTPMPSGNLPVAWITFEAFGSVQITWEEIYFLYATTTELQGGATILLASQTQHAAQLGFTYTFTKDNVFQVAQGSGDTYNVTNASPLQGLSFGLAQAATLSTTNSSTGLVPVNSIQVLSNESVSFTPEETISIFLSSEANNGSVLSQVASDAISFTLTSQSPTANIGFSDSNNTFFQS